MSDCNQHPESLAAVARNCATTTAIWGGAVVGAAALLATSIDHLADIERFLRFVGWLCALGGQFWGAVAGGVTGLVLVLWAACVLTNAGDHCTKREQLALIAAAVVGVVVWILSGAFVLFDAPAIVGIYQEVATWLWKGPLCAAVLTFFVAAPIATLTWRL